MFFLVELLYSEQFLKKKQQLWYLLQAAVWMLLYRNRPCETHCKEQTDGSIVYNRISH